MGIQFLILILVVPLLVTSVEHECVGDMFKCSEGPGCVYPSWRCDGEKDCNDGSDEVACDPSNLFAYSNETESETTELPPTTIPTIRTASFVRNMTRCGSGALVCADHSACIPWEFRCDNYVDCEDYSDELNCNQPNSLAYFNQSVHATTMESTVPTTTEEQPKSETNLVDIPMRDSSGCVDGMLICANFAACIREKWRCDKERDCEDGSDELNCDKPNSLLHFNQSIHATNNSAVQSSVSATTKVEKIRDEPPASQALIIPREETTHDYSEIYTVGTAEVYNPSIRVGCSPGQVGCGKCMEIPYGYECLCSEGFVLEQDTCIPKISQPNRAVRVSINVEITPDIQKEQSKPNNSIIFPYFSETQIHNISGEKTESSEVQVKINLTVRK